MEEGNVGNYRSYTEVASATSFETMQQEKLLNWESPIVIEDVHEDSSDSALSDDEGSVGTFSPAEPRNGVEDLAQLTSKKIFDIASFGTQDDFIRSRIENGHETSSFLVTNLSIVVAQFNQWRTELPMVDPFYAVKCNPDVMTLQLLALLGCGFDCASQGEIDLILNGLGELSVEQRAIASRNIVYANPAKMKAHVNFAIEHNVQMTVFDGEDELYKLASLPNHESLQLLMRLATDDKSSLCRFSHKFGCRVQEAPRLLEIAHSLGLNVAGVSFHVGSGCGDGNAYLTALDHAYMVFQEAERQGMPPMHLVDIGGGFPGGLGGCGAPGMPSFQELAAKIREGVACFVMKMKRPRSSFRFIAEPGRYFATATTTIVTQVYSRKGGMNQFQALYVDDGVYGSFNNVVYDHVTLVPRKLSPGEDSTDIPTAVFGPTCDGLDQMCAMEKTVLPRCEVGDWLVWDHQGAYTHTASFVFNGYTHVPKRTYCF